MTEDTRGKSIVDIFVVLPVHNEPLVTSFQTHISESVDDFWSSIIGYITVEINLRCKDKGLDPDYSSLKHPLCYRMGSGSGGLEPLVERSQFERIHTDVEYRKAPFVVFKSVASPEDLKLLATRFRDVFPGA